MAGLRQVPGVEVCTGNAHTAKHAQPGRLKMLDVLPPEKKPSLVRGDNAFGNDPLMTALEERNQPYRFKLKLSKNVKRHIGRLFRQSDWTDAGQGWEGKEGELALAAWQHKRRVVVLRRPLLGEVVVAGAGDGQQLLACVEANRKDGKGITGDEYAVLVTHTDDEILCLGQLYRDRDDADQPAGRRTPRSGGFEHGERCGAAAQNAFDQLKNQWGCGEFTAHDLHCCRLAARGVALAYDRRKSLWDNRWSLFVRLVHPDARRSPAGRG